MTDQNDWHTTHKLHHELGRGDPFAAAIRATRMAMLITDPRQDDNPIVFANRAFSELTGYELDDIVGRNCRFLQGPDTAREAVDKIREAIANKHDIKIDILNYRKDGSTFWNALYISPVMNEDDEVQFFFASQLDVTDRMRNKLESDQAKDYFEMEVAKRTEELRTTLERLQEVVEAKTVLLHEVDHRVKNNLQMISSLLTLQARSLSDPGFREVLYGILERIEALSTVHRRLYELEDIGRFNVSDFTRDLASDLVSATGRKDIETRFHLDNLEVPAAKASPLALIINELLTNALKHAFKQREGGVLDITVKRENGNFLIVIADNGGGVACEGAAAASTAPGFGAKLVDILARQLNASITRTVLSPGLRVELHLPVEQPTRSTER